MALTFFFSPQCQNLCVYFVFGCLFVPINECKARISACSHIHSCFLTVNLLTQWDVILNWPELNSCELFLASWIALGVLWLPSCSSDWLWEVQKEFPHSDHLDLCASVINCVWKKQHWRNYLTLSLCVQSSLLCSANVFVLCWPHQPLAADQSWAHFFFWHCWRSKMQNPCCHNTCEWMNICIMRGPRHTNTFCSHICKRARVADTSTLKWYLFRQWENIKVNALQGHASAPGQPLSCRCRNNRNAPFPFVTSNNTFTLWFL